MRTAGPAHVGRASVTSVDIASVHASSRVPSMVLESTSGPVMSAVLGRVPVVAAFVLPPATDIVAIAASAVFIVLAVVCTATVVVIVSPISAVVAATILIVAVAVLVTLSHSSVAAIIPMVTTEIATVAPAMVLAVVVVPALATTSFILQVFSSWWVATLVLPNNK